MNPFEVVSLIVAAKQRCEDRLAILEDESRTVIVVADGAGGVGSGEAAAETVIREVTSFFTTTSGSEQWQAILQSLDYSIGEGEATAVVVELLSTGIFGASVGDSQAWILQDETIIELTAGQIRKPLLGSGEAQVNSFYSEPLSGTLLVATDGFCNYVKRERLARVITPVPFLEIPRRCVEMVRLPSGDLWDDIGLVACRVRPVQRTRQRYSIE